MGSLHIPAICHSKLCFGAVEWSQMEMDELMKENMLQVK